jgi:hypothetical protein
LNPGIEAYRDGAVEARFSFTNTGTSPWEIVSVEPDCGCTVANVARPTVTPGETGDVLARFTVADRVGRHEKHLVVYARDAAGKNQSEPVARLTLVINLPELVRITPARLTWALGEEREPKTMLVEAASAEMPIEHIRAKSTQALFKPEVRTLEPGRRYEVAVAPTSTEILLTAHLAITCEFARPPGAPPTADNPPRLFVVVADIAPPNSGATASAARGSGQ